MKSFLIYPYFEKIVLDDQIFFEPQKDLMELCDSMNIGFWVYHAETKSVYSNQTFFELLGLEVNKNTSNLQYITSLVEIDELRELKKILKTKKIEDLNGFEYKLKYTANVFSRAIKLKCIFKEIKSQKFLYIYIADRKSVV